MLHTAYHIDELSKNVSIAFMIQETIDRGLQDRLNALEEVVLFMGNDFKIRLSVQCPSLVYWVCLTHLEYNTSERDWSNSVSIKPLEQF